MQRRSVIIGGVAVAIGVVALIDVLDPRKETDVDVFGEGLGDDGYGVEEYGGGGYGR